MAKDEIKYIDYELVMAAFRFTISALPNREKLIRDFTSVLPAKDNLPSLRDLATRYMNAEKE